MSVTWQYHHDAKAAFERIAQIRGMEGDYDLVRGLIDDADPRPVVPIESLAPDQEKSTALRAKVAKYAAFKEAVDKCVTREEVDKLSDLFFAEREREESEWPPPCVRRIGRNFYAYLAHDTSPVGPFGTDLEAREFLEGH